MAKSSTKSTGSTAKSKWGPVPVAGVTLAARAIAEQHRTEEFIAECEIRGYHLRASREFIEFANAFASGEQKKVPSVTPAAAPMSAEAAKFAAAATKCDNTFKKKAPKA